MTYFHEESIWAAMRQNLSLVVCEQHRRRLACAYMQPDQRVCCSLIERYILRLATNEISVFLASLCSWYESHCVGNPEDRFCQGKAHMSSNTETRGTRRAGVTK